MNVRSSIFGASAIVAVLATSACATVFTGTTGESQVLSDPQGAECTVAGRKVVTPGTVPVRHSASAVQVVCTKDGYEKSYSMLESKFNGAAIGNLIFPFPWLIDLATGNAWTHEDVVEVELDKEKA
jgi:hypothetical protein